jgi:glutaminyl-peptide cyclotransferase
VTRAHAPLLALSAALLVLATGCAGAPAAASGGSAEDPASVLRAGVAAGTPVLRPTVLGTLPHDTDAWTEGLEIDGGVLYEGTGLSGRSELRELDPATGRPLREVPLPDELYGEGVTALGSTVWQLTWEDGVALRWDVGPGRAGPPAPPRRLPWAGEGWGLCHTSDGRLVASDGSDRLRVLSGSDLTPVRTVPVRLAGRPLRALNELECTPSGVWANVYQTDWLVRIDLVSGQVTAAVDAGGLLPADHRGGLPQSADVLNGIAAVPGTDQFLLTGKYWPSLFRVRFTSVRG